MCQVSKAVAEQLCCFHNNAVDALQAGRVAVYGDSNCLDSSHQRSSCYNLLIKLIQYAAEVMQLLIANATYLLDMP